ncbi:MAG: hypothetical protein MAG795_01228 [Candidatus Woesearchaeota archaeon]|nr:hypothetical protein [Candidatus Woesearchaeota archaeon]
MAISGFQDVFLRLESMGLTDVLLPFLLIFTIVYSVLHRVNIFGDRKNVNAVIAIIMALLVVIPHVTGDYPAGADVVEIMNNAIPNVSIFIVAIVMLLIMIGVFGVNVNIAGTSLGGIVALVSFLIVAAIFGNSAGWFGNRNLPPWLSFLRDSDAQALIIVLLFFGIIVWFITSEPGDGPNIGEGMMSMFNNLGNALERRGGGRR